MLPMDFDPVFHRLRKAYGEAIAGTKWPMVKYCANGDPACRDFMLEFEGLMARPESMRITRKAVCVLTGASSNQGIKGTITFAQDQEDGFVEVQGEIRGLSMGKHGFAIYENGDLSNESFSSVGRHFNPDGVGHGGPEDPIRHVGDLGNVQAAIDGIARVNFRDKIISLCGRKNITGRALIVHSNEDDLGKGTKDEARSHESGNTGARIAGGVIGLAYNTYNSPISDNFLEAFISLQRQYQIAIASDFWHMFRAFACADALCFVVIEALEELMRLPPQVNFVKQINRAQGTTKPSGLRRKAVCRLTGPSGVKGIISFIQETASATVSISGDINGLTPGKHGFYDQIRHVGDLGNIESWQSAQMVTRIDFSDKLISLHGANNILGRTLVVHEKEDDLGKGIGAREVESYESGNAGTGIAYGVIRLAHS